MKRPDDSAPDSETGVKPAILDRLGDVRGADRRLPGEVGDGARDAQHTVIRPCGEHEPRQRVAKELVALLVGLAEAVDFARSQQ